jgi:uncharacterized protein DUF3455
MLLIKPGEGVMKHISCSFLIAAALVVAIGLSSCQKEDPILQPAGEGAHALLGRIAPSVVTDIQVPEGNHLVYAAYAQGVQIYQVRASGSGYAWVFVAPDATLYADPAYNGVVGSHYPGPTWETLSGSKVVGKKIAGVTPDLTAVPWLLLQAVSSQGPGVLDSVTYIQRLNTVGGIAPSTGADAAHLGDYARVPYTAEYYFYKAED